MIHSILTKRPFAQIFFPFILIFILICSTQEIASAQSIYVRSDATGANNGTSWKDAFTALPSSFARGSTYYIAAGNYTSPNIPFVTENGTLAITIKKATDSDHGADSTNWKSEYGAQAKFSGSFGIASSFVVIDGVSRSNWTSGHGFSITGPAGGGAGFFIQAGLKDITIKYVHLVGHAVTATPNGGAGGDNAIWLNGTTTRLNVSYSYAYSWGSCMFKTLTGSIESATIEYNRFEWNRSSEANHAEGVFPYGMNNSIWRHNYWIDIEGTGVIMLGNGANNEIYGNVVYWTASYPHPSQDKRYISNGTFSNWDAYRSIDNKFYNNTIIVPVNGGIEFGISFGSSPSTGTARNNLYYGMPVAAGTQLRNVYGTSVNSDYDIFYNLTHSNQTNGVNGSGTPFNDIAIYDFSLNKATSAGATLPSPYNTDITGVSRGSNVNNVVVGDGVWDRGAFEFDSRGSGTPRPPSNLQVRQN